MFHCGPTAPGADLVRMRELQAFPASAAGSLVSGYCADFIDLAATMAQTLEQVTMRSLDIGGSKEQLARVERGMRDLADAIGDVLKKIGGTAEAPAKKVAERIPDRIPDRSAPKLVQVTPVTAGTANKVPAGRVARPAPEAPTPEARAPQKPVAPPAAAPKPTASSAPVASGGRGNAAPKEPSAPPAAAAAAAPESSMLHGSTETLPMRSVFQFLGRTRKSGQLHVAMEKEKVRFEFVDGCMVGTSSTNSPKDELLGSILVELGLVNSQQVEALVKEHGDGRQRLGAALIKAKLVDQSQLADVIDRQTTRRFQRIVTQKRASYEFAADEDQAGGAMRIRSRSATNAPSQG